MRSRKSKILLAMIFCLMFVGGVFAFPNSVEATITYNAGTNTIILDGANIYTLQDIFNTVGAAGVFEKQENQYWSGANIVLGDGTDATKLIDSEVSFQLGTLAVRREFTSNANSEWKMEDSHIAIYRADVLANSYGTWEFTGCTIVYRGLSYGWYMRGDQTHKDCYFDVCGWVTREGVGNYDNCVFALCNGAGCYGGADYGGTFFYYTEGEINKLTIRDGVTGFFMQEGNAVLKNSVIENCEHEVYIQSGSNNYATLIDTQITGESGKLIFKTNTQYLLDKKSFDLKVTDKNGAVINGATVTIKDKHDNFVSYLDSNANLAEDLDSSETGVDVTDGSQFSVNDVLLLDGEFVKITNIAGNTLTVTRNYYSSPNYFADIHGNGKDVFIVQALTTDALGQIPTQLGYYRIFRGTSETETVYTPHTLKISHQDYPSREFEFTLDKKIDWTIALKDKPMNVGSVKVWGTEYADDEAGTIYAQVFYGDGSPCSTIASADITATVYKSDGTMIINGAQMSYVANTNGIYKYDFTGGTFSAEGVYIIDVKVDSGPAPEPVITAYDSNEIHISQTANKIKSMVADIWNYSPRTLTSFGTLVADIWNAATLGMSTGGSIGKRLADNINAAISSRSSHTSADVDTTLSTSHGAGSWIETTASTVWNYAGGSGRTLSNFGTLVVDVWNNATRKLTSQFTDEVAPIDLAQVADISDLATSAELSTAETNLTAEIDENQALIAELNDISASDVWSFAGDRKLSASGVDEVWEYALTQIGEAGSIGKLLKDNIDASVSSRSSHTAADIWDVMARTLSSNANFNDPTSAQNAAAVWAEATKELTNYGNDITAADVWEVMSDTLTTNNTIGKQLADNCDVKISTRSTLTASDVDTQLSVSHGSGSWEGSTASNIADAVWNEVRAGHTAGGTFGQGVASVQGNVTGSISSVTGAVGSVTGNVGGNLQGNVVGSVDSVVGSVGSISDVSNIDTTLSSSHGSGSWEGTTPTAIWSHLGRTLTAPNLDVGSLSTSADITSQTESIKGLADKDLTEVESDLANVAIDVSYIRGVVDTIYTDTQYISGKVDDILTKWGIYSASDIIGYVDEIETRLGTPNDDSSQNTVFGRIKIIQEKWGTQTAQAIYDKAKDAYDTIVLARNELGYEGTGTTAKDDLILVKGYVDEIETLIGSPSDETTVLTLFGKVKDVRKKLDELDIIDTKINNLIDKWNDYEAKDIINDLTNISNQIANIPTNGSVSGLDDLYAVSTENLTETKDIQNKLIQLKALIEINRSLIENRPIIKTYYEWGSVILKMVITNPASTKQTVYFKTALPKEIKEEYIIKKDDDLKIEYDTEKEGLYISANIILTAGESTTKKIEVKDIWQISEDEIESLYIQANDLMDPLKGSPAFAQGTTLKNDIDSRLDKIKRKQEEEHVTPEEHIMVYRENTDDLKVVEKEIGDLKDLVAGRSGAGGLLASIGGISTFATWGIIIVLIAGILALAMMFLKIKKKGK